MLFVSFDLFYLVFYDYMFVLFQALRTIFVDYVSNLTPLKRFDKNKLGCNKLLERVGKVNWQTAELVDLISIASELIMVSILTSSHILLKTTDIKYSFFRCL